MEDSQEYSKAMTKDQAGWEAQQKKILPRNEGLTWNMKIPEIHRTINT